MEAKYAGLSPYNYSMNNPVMMSDPNGADPQQQTGGATPPIVYTHDEDGDIQGYIGEVVIKSSKSSSSGTSNGGSNSGGGSSRELGAVFTTTGNLAFTGTPTGPIMFDPQQAQEISQAVTDYVDKAIYVAFGFINAVSSNLLLGAGRKDPSEYYGHEFEFAIGQLAGDVFSAIAGTDAAIFFGGSAAVATGFGQLEIAVPATAAATYSGVVAVNSAKNIALDIQNVLKYATSATGTGNAGSTQEPSTGAGDKIDDAAQTTENRIYEPNKNMER
jgi:hypothetical protein